MATIAASGDDVQAWLLTEAKVHKRAVGKVVKLLETEEVFCVDDLLHFSRLTRFKECGLTALTADKIHAALAPLASQPLRANQPRPRPCDPDCPTDSGICTDDTARSSTLLLANDDFHKL